MPQLTVLLNLAAAIALSVPAMAETDIYIGIESSAKARGGGVVLGYPGFIPKRPKKPQDTALAGLIHDTIHSDLLFSRYFNILEKGPEVSSKKPGRKIMRIWKNLGASHLITGVAASMGEKMTLSARVYDLNSRKSVVEKYYRGDKRSAARAAHMFSDEVVRQLTGKRGIAGTRIAFACGSTGKKEIYTVDYDGQNPVRLTRDSNISLLPRWSADGTRIYYTSYRRGNPDMYEIDLRQGKNRPFTGFQGLNIPGGISPDGTKMVMTLSKGKDPNIYLLDLKTREAKRITSRSGVDSSATYSPDGKQIAFVSDRSGNPQIYIMELESRKARRLTRLNWCDSPAWSPTGEWITFAAREKRRDPINIYLVDITGNQLRRLTHDAGSNENPTWSPDGRFIAFTTTRNGSRQLYIMDSDGSAPHLTADMPGEVYTPAWGP